MADDHSRRDASQWGLEQLQAWEEWDFAVVCAQALGWHLQRLTHQLIAANCAWGAAAVAEVDRMMYSPTAVLGGAYKVTRAGAAAAAWDRALVRSGISGIIVELEKQGRLNKQVGDAIAGWGDRVEAQRDRLAAASLSLRKAYLVAVGGGARTDDSVAEDLRLI
jgi:hypothetical protein